MERKILALAVIVFGILLGTITYLNNRCERIAADAYAAGVLESRELTERRFAEYIAGLDENGDGVVLVRWTFAQAAEGVEAKGEVLDE